MKSFKMKFIWKEKVFPVEMKRDTNCLPCRDEVTAIRHRSVQTGGGLGGWVVGWVEMGDLPPFPVVDYPSL